MLKKVKFKINTIFDFSILTKRYVNRKEEYKDWTPQDFIENHIECLIESLNFQSFGGNTVLINRKKITKSFIKYVNKALKK